MSKERPVDLEAYYMEVFANLKKIGKVREDMSYQQWVREVMEGKRPINPNITRTAHKEN